MFCGFDFDGTLADSKTVYYKAVHQYAEKNQLKLPAQHEMNMAFGNPHPPLFEGWGNREKLIQRLDEISEIIDDKLCQDPLSMPLFPGVFNLLESLQKDGILLAIVTSRASRPLLRVMEAHKLLPFFKTIRSEQNVSENNCRDKPHADLLNSALKELNVAHKNAIMIGDTWMDIQMAKNANVFAVGVSWGYHPEQILTEYKADIIVHEASQIKSITEKSFA
ncbi:MAG TPA: HAD family hydrolase [Gammaproteobacteria bacterium]|nr:HAD family hydrolase [Gammaproteobacteria bacterium]